MGPQSLASFAPRAPLAAGHVVDRCGQERAELLRFDAYLMVDWSASSTPKKGRDSIWYCLLERHRGGLRRTLANPSTRAAARQRLASHLTSLARNGRRVLVGFDFAFGYPAGLAERLGLTGVLWRELWKEIATLIRDDEDNGNNRFDVAAAFNQRISGEAFPFWGCPRGRSSALLQARMRRPPTASDLPERRLTDRRAPRAQPVWKLCYPGAVGGQTLLGIPVVRALTRALPAVSCVWPFETGLRPPRSRGRGRAQAIFVEVYPSLVAVDGRRDRPKDAAQVEALGHHFAALDDRRVLGALFWGPAHLSPEQRRLVETEEGWILGVR